MSFGFSVGDFIGTIELAWKLYTKCYKVSKGAPKDFQCLIQEINMLHSSIKLLQEEANNKDSVLVRAGNDRVEMVKNIMLQVNVTLNELEKHSRKYESLSKIHSSSIRKWWTGVKWAAEAADLDALRNKLVYHNGVINLLLTSCGNSSLQRIEDISLKVEMGVNDIKDMIRNPTGKTPTISAIQGDEILTISLSRKLMEYAQIERRWSAIGVDEWIQAGSWWLLKSQLDLYTGLPPERRISWQSYANLIKAAWILIDIITRHPQLDYLDENTGYGVKLLVETIRRELRNVGGSGLTTPTLSELYTCDLSIWETQVKGSTLKPNVESSSSGLSRQAWVTEDEYVLFQRFVYYQTNSYSIEMPCIVLFLMHKTKKEASIVLRDQSWLTLATFIVRDVNPYPIDNIMHVGDQKIKFSTKQDVQHLCAISEATVEYLFYCKFDENKPEILNSFTLLFSIKNNFGDAVERLVEDEKIYPEIDKTSRESTRVEYSTQLLLATQDLAHRFHRMDKHTDFRTPQSEHFLSLFLWCVKQGHNAVAIILSQVKGVYIDEEDLVMCKSIHDAARSKNSKLVQLVLPERGIDVNAPNKDGLTALQLCAENGNVAAVDNLLKAGADAKADNSRALHFAAEKGHLDVVNRLIEAGADAKVDNSRALQSAAEKGHLDVVNRLIEAGANAKASNSWALQSAVEMGHLDVVNRLIEAGADAKASNSRALQFAAWNGHLDVVNKLIEAGADAEAGDSQALQSAARNGHLDVVNRLIEAGADAGAGGSRALQSAAERGHLDVVNKLIDAGAGADNSWALESAAREGHLDVVNRLIEAGADAGARDSWALRFAAEKGHLDVVNRLIEAGADPLGLDSHQRAIIETWNLKKPSR